MSFHYFSTTNPAWEKAGDKEKFARLYQTYKSDMYQTAFSILLNHTMEEDAVQDACLNSVSC